MDLMPPVPPAVNKQSTDLELFSAIEQKQMDALNFLYDRYGRLVYSVALRVLNNVEEAEDIVQETFLKLWQRSEIYQPSRGSLSGFLIMLTRSKAIDRVRSRKSHHQRLHRWQTTLHAPPLPNAPLESATLSERAKLVREALNQLSDAERKVLENAYYGGLSQSEIAKQSDIPLGTVKSRSRQALRKLRSALKHKL